MARPRKPIPKTQKEISNSLVTPYNNMDNPNISSNSNESQTGISINRAEKISFKNDNTKHLTVGLEDIDEAVFYYFNEIIKPFVYQNNERIVVPVIYSSPENWKSSQRDGYYRDKNGAIMLPIIAINKTDIRKDRTVANKLDANHPNLYSSFVKIYNPKNAYNNFNIVNNKIPVKQYNLSVIPSYVTIEYNCLIQTYYVEQLNKIIEAIEYASDSYWGDPERFKFRAFIDNFTSSIELTSESERFAKSTFIIRLKGYIIPDNIQKDLNSVKLLNSKSKITITTEVVSDINNITPVIHTYNPPISTPLTMPQWYGHTDAILTYTYEDSNNNLIQFLSTGYDANVVVDIYDGTKYVIFLSKNPNAIIYDVNNFVITKAFIKTTISQQIANGTYITLYQYKTKEPATIGTYKLR